MLLMQFHCIKKCTVAILLDKKGHRCILLHKKDIAAIALGTQIHYCCLMIKKGECCILIG